MLSIKYISIFLFLLGSLNMLGQNYLIKPCNSCTGKNGELNHFLEHRIAVEDYQYINIDLQAIKQTKITLSFFETKASVRQKNLKIRGLENYIWSAKTANNDISITISVMGRDVQGMIRNKLELYRIETLGDNYILVKINQGYYPNEICHIEEQSDKQIDNNTTVPISDNSNFSNWLKTEEPFECKLRVLVLYTPAADNLSSNIHNTITLAVEETNQAFENSNINREIELVYVGRTEYTEATNANNVVANLSIDRGNFLGTTDGIMDEVHDLREQYNADICVLISEIDGACGFADVIKASDNQAFCIVDWDCATGNYTFGHEIGHLIGCRHQTLIDPDVTPREYAHGFVDVDNEFRTIMGTGWDCALSGVTCTRIQFFSNPDINFNGNPIGDIIEADNARLIDEKFPNAMSYRQPQQSLMLDGDNINSLEIIGDVISLNSITNNNSLVSVPSDGHLCLRTGQFIELSPGFETSQWSELSARITTITECGEPDGEPSNYGLNGGDGGLDQTLKVTNFGTFIYPNPTTDKTILTFNNTETEKVTISLYDYSGQLIKTIKQRFGIGQYQQVIDCSKLSAGIYFLKVKQGKKNHEIIKLMKL